MVYGESKGEFFFFSSIYFVVMLIWVLFYDKPMEKSRRLVTAADGSEKKHVIQYDGNYHVVRELLIPPLRFNI